MMRERERGNEYDRFVLSLLQVGKSRSWIFLVDSIDIEERRGRVCSVCGEESGRTNDNLWTFIEKNRSGRERVDIDWIRTYIVRKREGKGREIRCATGRIRYRLVLK